MNFLITEDEVTIINSDDIKLGQQVPLGFWKLDAAQFKGVFLKKTDFKLSHGKIYGKSQNIANHIVQAYKCTPEDKNMGVLLSNGRGFGAFDAKILTDLAEKYLTYHKLRPNQLAIVQKKMVKYVGQLFDNALETNKIRKLTRCSYEIVR